MSHVEIADVSKVYGDTLAAKNVSLDIEKGEFYSLLGPSGCGKTTTLRMIAGFIRPTAGSIRIAGRDVVGVPPEKRGIGIVFQNYAIFPHLNVYDNIAFGLRMRKVKRGDIETRVRAALRQVGLPHHEERYQREMSGGEQQRVALARVLVTEPEILLLDEPLSALDKQLREEMKYWIKDLQKQLGITTVYVTHDQGEALAMSDRMAVMRGGTVLQVGTPREIYERPADLFVTSFIGESNLLPAEVGAIHGGEMRVRIGQQDIRTPKLDGATVGTKVWLALRPEHILMNDNAGSDNLNGLRATILKETFQGSIIRYEAQFDSQKLVVEEQNSPDRAVYPVGAEVDLYWRVDNSIVLAMGPGAETA